MRYWVFKDAQITGPMSMEEISRMGGGDSNLLLCAEGADGSRESDWKSVGEFPELAGIFPERKTAVAEFEAPEFASWPVRDFSPEELIGMPYFQFWEPRFERPPARSVEPEAPRRRDEGLETKIVALGAKIEHYEQRQGEILDRLAEKDKILEERQKEIERLQQELEKSRLAAVKLEVPRPEINPPQIMPPQASAEHPLLLPDLLSASIAELPVEKKPQIFEIPPAIVAPVKGQQALSITQFSPPTPETPSATPETLDQAIPATREALDYVIPPTLEVPEESPLVEIPSFTTPSEPARETAPAPGEAPLPGLEPLAGGTTPLPQWSSGSFGFPPAPVDSPSTRPLGPSSAAFEAIGPVSEARDLSALPATMPTPSEEFAAESSNPAAEIRKPPTVLPTAPASISASAAPKRGRGKAFWIVGILGLTGLCIAFLWLGRGQNASNNADQQPSAPMEVSEQPEAKTSSQQPATPQTIPGDRSQEAIDLVKNHALDGDRGTISSWLQYSYLAPNSREKWTTSPGDSEGVYLVQYEVIPENRASAGSESTVYVFRADLNQNTVQGVNRTAKDLLAGMAPRKPANTATVKKPTANKKISKHRSLKPGEIPLLPLPTDAQLPRSTHRSVDEEH